jgi:FkbM family methyltransferase
MFEFIKRKLERRRIKRHFNEYGSKVYEYDLPDFGIVKFAKWLNPLDEERNITQGQVNFYKKFLNPGDFAIDIGAHIGDTAMPMALRVGKNGLVLAFDPNPHVFKILTENAQLNKEITNIVPVNLAISAYDGEFFFNSSEATFNNGGISETQQNKHGKYGLQQKIKGVNLENFLKSNYREYLDRLKVIKIDAEGYDIEIIKSILPVIQKHKPHLIVECFKQLNRQGRYDLYDTIANLGYDLYYMEDFDDEAKLELIKRENMTDRRHFNILTVPV